MLARWKVAVGVAVVGAAGFFVVSRATRPPEAPVVKAVREDVVSTLAVSGVLESADRTDIGSQLSGARVLRVLVDLGDEVQAGQPLIELDASEFGAAAEAARAQIARSQADLAAQRTGARNAQDLLAVAGESLDRATDLRIARENAATQLRTSEERLAQAEAALARTRAGGRDEAVRVAEAELRRSQALRDQAVRDRDRTRRLVEQQAVAASQLEVSETALQTAEASVQEAEQNLAQTRRPRDEDVRQAEAALREARAARDGAQRALTLAETNLRDRLAGRQSVVQARTQRDAAVSGQASAAASLAAAGATLRQAEAQLAKAVVRAPFGGRIADRLVEPGQIVSPGVPLLRLSSDRRLRVRLDVDEASLALLRVGEQATVSFDAFPELQVPAEVTEIGSSADFSRGTVPVRLRLNQVPPQLKPDLTADANIRVAEFKNAVVIPREALVNADSDPSVLVLRGDALERRPVKWARGNVESVVILEGLEEGESVVLQPRAFRPGQKVLPVAPKGVR